MSAYTGKFAKRVVSAMDDPQGVTDCLMVVAGAQVYGLGNIGVGRLIPAVKRLRDELDDELTTNIENEALDYLTPWTV